MSYDVTAGGEWFNITSNMHRFFKRFDVYPPDWHGKPRAEVAAAIEKALADIRSHDLEALRAEFDAPNGWGNVPVAINWLIDIHQACVRVYPDTVEVSW
jgi:hypothetical protein